MPLSGRATAAGTTRYAARVAGTAAGYFRSALGLTVSSIGCGTYLGESTDAIDDGYVAAVSEAVGNGCNMLDTAVNYRAQRSEIALGRALACLVESGQVARDELVVASKGGFIAYRLERPADPVQYLNDTFISAGLVTPTDLAGGIHCMAPDFLSQQISWSLANTGLRTLDIYYIHNPEVQLSYVDRSTFRNRLQLAFARLEEERAGGRIGCYGVATWDGLRKPPVSPGYINLEIMVRLAAEVGGVNHGLRVVQLPLSAAMPEAVTLRNQTVGNGVTHAVAAAAELGLTVVASASLGQGRLSPRAVEMLAGAWPSLAGAPERALQFTRSLAGVTTALAGMGSAAHARADLAVARVAPDPEGASRLARALAR